MQNKIEWYKNLNIISNENKAQIIEKKRYVSYYII